VEKIRKREQTEVEQGREGTRKSSNRLESAQKVKGGIESLIERVRTKRVLKHKIVPRGGIEGAKKGR